jgi:hypothetical protein
MKATFIENYLEKFNLYIMKKYIEVITAVAPPGSALSP